MSKKNQVRPKVNETWELNGNEKTVSSVYEGGFRYTPNGKYRHTTRYMTWSEFDLWVKQGAKNKALKNN